MRTGNQEVEYRYDERCQRWDSRWSWAMCSSNQHVPDMTTPRQCTITAHFSYLEVITWLFHMSLYIKL